MKKTIISAIVAAACLGAAAPAFAYEEGDWVVRFGATSVNPDDSSSNVVVGGADLGIGVNVNSNTQLGLNLAYFFTPQWNVEVLAATPFSHDIGLNTVGALAETKHLPPSVTANYYFAAQDSAFQPYVGAGLNYTIFFDEEFTAANENAGFGDLDLDASFGVTVQAGFDYMLEGNWHINGSVRWIDIDTDATFDLGGAAGSVDVEIDPWVYTLSLGYKF